MALLRAIKQIFPNFQKWAYERAGFNQYGLMGDDILHEDHDVQEALKRLPADVLDERNFRIIRALQLNLQKSVLPKEQWTKFEDEVHYLRPYLEEIKREREERERWDAEA